MRPRLEIRQMPIATLRPAAYNPRQPLRPGDEAYQKLQASLREFGLVEPLVWNEATGNIVGGHARLRILQDLGVTEAPVSVVRLSPDREKALNVILNNRNAQGRFDTAMLADLLEELADLPELNLTGFDQDDLADLRLEPVADPAPITEPNQVEVTLLVSPERFEAFSRRLDDWIAEFDLRCHVRR